MTLPRIVITGASGFLGRHLLAAMKDRYRIYALARRSQRLVRAPIHPNISWHQADIGDLEPLSAVFHRIREEGGAELLIHLAAHYDFTGEEDPEYWRTNVNGLRNVLELSIPLGLRRFVFASSVAACRFPPSGAALSENSPLDGDHPYAETKRIGEAMLGEYKEIFPSCSVRLGALFSDWGEYPPLFFFLGTWLSKSWKNRVLAGEGESAVPYLHIRDAVAFFLKLLDRQGGLSDSEILIASTDGAVSHGELFRESTRTYFGREIAPIRMPRPMCRLGLRVQDLLGRILGQRPFERPWMGKYIDRKLTVSGIRTRLRLGWAPNPRLGILRRMPFLIENYKTDPVEWNRRNWAAMKRVDLAGNLRIYKLLEAHEEEIVVACLQRLTGPEALTRFRNYLGLEPDELGWAIGQVFRHLMNSVRTREKALFRSYCRALAQRRHKMGFRCEEVCGALAAEMEICRLFLRRDSLFQGLDLDFHDHVEMTFRLGIDEVQDVFEERSGKFVPPEGSPAEPV